MLRITHLIIVICWSSLGFSQRFSLSLSGSQGFILEERTRFTQADSSFSTSEESPLTQFAIHPAYLLTENLGFSLGFGMGSQQFKFSQDEWMFTDFMVIPSEIFYKWEIPKRFHEHLRAMAGTDIQMILGRNVLSERITARTYVKSGFAYGKSFRFFSMELAISYLMQLKATELIDLQTQVTQSLDQNLLMISLNLGILNSGWVSGYK